MIKFKLVNFAMVQIPIYIVCMFVCDVMHFDNYLFPKNYIGVEFYKFSHIKITFRKLHFITFFSFVVCRLPLKYGILISNVCSQEKEKYFVDFDDFLNRLHWGLLHLR